MRIAAFAAALGLAAAALALPALGQVQSAPRASADAPPPIPAPRDVRYPGVMKLEVDATDLDRKIFWIKQTIPVARAGKLTLLYPEWIMGNHAPRGPLTNYTGLKITANGQPVRWTRDWLDAYALHVDVPQGARELNVEAQFLTPIEAAQGGAMITAEMMRVNWYVAALYPAGHYSRQVMVDASIKLPQGWDFGTALETASASGQTTTFRTVPFDVLVDSPLIAGQFLRKYDLDPGGRSRVTLNTAGDTAEQVDAKPEQIETLRELVRQMDRLYGARHYNHYDFLLTVSDRLAGSGIEHQRSSDNGVASGYFRQWDCHCVSRDLLAHEYNHSWNGKYRRGADLWTPNFNVPMRNSLLWVYEGQTQYWGFVIAARSGLLTKEETLDSLAGVAAQYQNQAGRLWRPLVDTTNDPIIAARRAAPWRDQQRSEDYYREGQLIWLDVDTKIRELSNNAKSLDDFAKAFFGVNDGDWGQLTYTWTDVVTTLNRVQPFDWNAFLQARVNEVAPRAPLDGFERGGYRLVYAEEPNDLLRGADTRARTATLTYSIGLTADNTGKITAVAWQGPAFKAGLTTAATILAVGDVAYTPEILRAAVAESRTKPVELLVKTGEQYRTVRLEYAGGHRYPKLEPIPGRRMLLDDILTPRAS
jgi:predicted metalloprotease with PDZ domain